MSRTKTTYRSRHSGTVEVTEAVREHLEGLGVSCRWQDVKETAGAAGGKRKRRQWEAGWFAATIGEVHGVWVRRHTRGPHEVRHDFTASVDLVYSGGDARDDGEHTLVFRVGGPSAPPPEGRDRFERHGVRGDLEISLNLPPEAEGAIAALTPVG